MKRVTITILAFSFFAHGVFADPGKYVVVFTQKASAVVPAKVEVEGFVGTEKFISCRNFRKRLEEANVRENELSHLIASYKEGRASDDTIRYVLDETKSYMGFYDYHSHLRLKLKWNIDPRDLASLQSGLKLLETNSLKVISNLIDFESDRVSDYKLGSDGLEFVFNFNLSEICSKQGLSFSIVRNCASTDLPSLDCEKSTKTTFSTGELSGFHPSKLRAEKVRTQGVMK